MELFCTFCLFCIAPLPMLVSVAPSYRVRILNLRRGISLANREVGVVARSARTSTLSTSPSRRTRRRCIHLQVRPRSGLSNPGLGGLAILLGRSVELLSFIEREETRGAAEASLILSVHEDSLAVMAKRVSSMGEARLNRLVARLRGAIETKVSSRRRNKRTGRVNPLIAILNRIALNERNTKKVEAFVPQLSVVVSTKTHSRPNLRCVEGSVAHQACGRRTEAAKLVARLRLEAREERIQGEAEAFALLSETPIILEAA